MSATFTDQAKQAFTAASDWSKQLVTLSTAVLTLTVTFSDKVFGNLDTTGKWLLWLAWLGYLVAILAGVMVLGALTGTLAAATTPQPTAVWSSATRIFALVQLVAFAVATILVAAFGFHALG